MSEPVDFVSIAAETGFSEKEVETFFKHFSTYTKGKDFLNPFEFRESLGLLGFVSETAFTDLLFNAFNTSKNNAVSFQEYIRGLHILTRGTNDEKLAFSFSLIDIDGKGYITLPEFELIMQSTQRILNYVDDITGSGSGSVEVNKKTIEKLFQEMDKDCNGRVTLDEFKHCMTSSTNLTTWMNHIGNEREMGSKMDITAHLPFYVHHNLGIISQQATEVLNTLSSILTLSNTLKVRVMKERVVEKSEEEKPVEEEKPTEEVKEEEKEQNDQK